MASFNNVQATSPAVAVKEQPDSLQYCEEYHGRTLIDGMRRQREANRFSNLTLHVGETVISAHKIVLACSSHYFEALLSTNMREGRQDEIHLEKLDGPIVASLVDFIYSGQILITTETVQRLLETANFLDINGVCKACCKFIEDRLDAESCIGVLSLADHLGEETLKEFATSYLMKNFQKVVEFADFTNMEPLFFAKILGGETLCLLADSFPVPLAPPQQEAKLAQLVIQFVRADPVTRSEYIPQLLAEVRLPLLEPHDLDSLGRNLEDIRRECSQFEKSFQFCTQGMELIEKARHTQVKEPRDSTASPWCRPRKFAGLTNVSSEMYAYHCGAGYINHTFNDQEIAVGGYVVGMKIWIRRWDGNSKRIIGGLLVFYNNGKSIMHGGDHFPEVYEFHLEAEEYITGVNLKCGWMLDSLTFTSNRGRTFGPYGGTGGGALQVQNPASGLLAYISGSVMTSDTSLAVVKISFTWEVYAYKLNPQVQQGRQHLEENKSISQANIQG